MKRSSLLPLSRVGSPALAACSPTSDRPPRSPRRPRRPCRAPWSRWRPDGRTPRSLRVTPPTSRGWSVTTRRKDGGGRGLRRQPRSSATAPTTSPGYAPRSTWALIAPAEGLRLELCGSSRSPRTGRRQLDFSSSYFDVNQAVISYVGLADRQGLTLAEPRTPSSAPRSARLPWRPPRPRSRPQDVSVFNDNAAAVSALKNGQSTAWSSTCPPVKPTWSPPRSTTA